RLRAAKLRPGMFYKTFDNFYEGAQELRREFEKNFAPPSKSAARSGTLNPKRFVWDNWYVEDQYILARTPAWEYFSRTVYARFHRALLKFGREILGCYDV